MKSLYSPKCHIDYPFSSNILYKGTSPFLRIITQNHVLYGFANNKIQLVDLKTKPNYKEIIFNKYEIPAILNQTILNQATKDIKGITFKLLYVNCNQYLCLEEYENIYISLIILTIELNSKGYYEIQGIKNIIN